MNEHITRFFGALQEGVAVRPIKVRGNGGWGRNRTISFKPLKIVLLVFVTPFALHRFFEKLTSVRCQTNSIGLSCRRPCSVRPFGSDGLAIP